MGKKKGKQKPDAPDHSKIIEQCVIYVQALAAYDAGFSVDRTGNSRYAGKGRQIKNASRAISKLIGLTAGRVLPRFRHWSFTLKRECSRQCTG
jgi:hypothetical protein